MLKQSIFKAGNSLCISIPSRLVKKFGIRAGQVAQVEVFWDDGSVKISFPDAQQLSLLKAKNK